MTIFDPSEPIVLVYLAAGVQGSAVVRAALAHGLSVRALVRDRARAPSFPKDRVELAEGDLDDPASLRTASAGVTHTVLQIPTGPVETMADQARNAASASIAAGLRSVVLKLASASRPAPCAEPSFIGNALVEDALRQAGLAFASVRPTMYLDNLLKPSARSEIVGSGLFAPPIAATQRIAWTCVDDCARAAIELLVQGATGDHRIAGARAPERRRARITHLGGPGPAHRLPGTAHRCVRARGRCGDGRRHGSPGGLQVPLLRQPSRRGRCHPLPALRAACRSGGLRADRRRDLGAQASACVHRHGRADLRATRLHQTSAQPSAQACYSRLNQPFIKPSS